MVPGREYFLPNVCVVEPVASAGLVLVSQLLLSLQSVCFSTARADSIAMS